MVGKLIGTFFGYVERTLESVFDWHALDWWKRPPLIACPGSLGEADHRCQQQDGVYQLSMQRHVEEFWTSSVSMPEMRFDGLKIIGNASD